MFTLSLHNAVLYFLVFVLGIYYFWKTYNGRAK